MSFYFDSLADFLWMDGHGPYVWSCFILTIAIFVGMAISPGIRRAKFFKQQRALLARQQSSSEV